MTFSEPSQPSPGWDGSFQAALGPGVHLRAFAEERILLDSSSGDYFALSEIGGQLVDSLAAGLTLEQAARRLLDAYEVEWDVLSADLLRLVHELLSRKLIIARAPISPLLETPSS